MSRALVSLAIASVALLTTPASAADAIEQTAENGPVVALLRIEPAEPVIGDVITLVLEVRAEPDVELLMPEFGEALGRFEIVDFAPRDQTDPRGATISSQTYRLQPARSGRQTIPPLRVEFIDRRAGHKPAPDGEDSYELLTERVVLEIGSVLPAEAPLALRDPHGPLGARRDALGPWWAWALGATALLAAAAPFLWRQYRAALAKRRQATAYEVARAELDALLYAGRPGGDRASVDSFYVKLSTIVRNYLENRFALRSPELTTEEFLGEMGRSPDLARSHQQLLRELLQHADLVKFAAHLPNSDDIEAHILAAQNFLEETRDQAVAMEPAGG